jgi:hypothetical protein
VSIRNILCGLGVCAVVALGVAQSHADVIVAEEQSYFFSDRPDTNVSHDDNPAHLLVGFHEAGTVQRIRAILQFDLSGLGGIAVDSASLTLTHEGTSYGGDDDLGEYLDLVVKNNGAETFGQDTVTWNSVATPGGYVGGPTLSSATAQTRSTPEGTEVVFASSADFVVAAQEAIDNDGGILTLIVYSPETEAAGLADPEGDETGICRFWPTAALTVVPEPGSLALLVGAGSAALLTKKRRGEG